MNEIQAIEAITKDILAGYLVLNKTQVQKHRNGNMLTTKQEKYMMANY
tara:strand:+ start:756 stop:899 length:144 start_codon:yes stop_codon:yes gene_type:complete